MDTVGSCHPPHSTIKCGDKRTKHNLLEGVLRNIIDETLRGKFDSEIYLQENRDVAAAGIDPWDHYITYGQSEGRRFPEIEQRKGVRYISSVPDPQSALDIFEGEWSSAMPAESGLKTAPGHAKVFEDGRITWLDQTLGPVSETNILEIGPLEGGHTYMLHNLGARSITSVETNERAYLKCLTVKEIFELDRAKFLLGDAISFMEREHRKYDIAMASGVLYHMTDPLRLLRALSKSSDRIFIWTHYFDEKIIANRDDNEIFDRAREIAPGYFGAKRRYPQSSLDWAGFSGGADSYAVWMTRDSILAYLKSEGFSKINIAFDHSDHSNGPALSLCAQRV
jgi:hypothetical protein